jgi:hypothetical protein
MVFVKPNFTNRFQSWVRPLSEKLKPPAKDTAAA